MFQIFLLYTNFDIRIRLFGYNFFFQITRSGSINNTSDSDMFRNTIHSVFLIFWNLLVLLITTTF